MFGNGMMQPRGCIFYVFILVVIMGRTKSVEIAEDVLERLKFIRCKRQEYFICISLNARNEIISRRTVTIGTLTSAPAHPREVFAGAIKDRAASVIVAHNHPSGYALPSNGDIDVTQQLVAAGQILGIPLLDHLIMAKDEVFSFKAHCLIM
jgi:DNA repair protein RadC